MTDEQKKPEFFVRYRVLNFKGDQPDGTFRRGPFPSWEEAQSEANDIRGFEGVFETVVEP